MEEEVQSREPTRLFRGLQETGRRVVPFTVAFREAAAPPERHCTSVDFVRPSREAPAPSGFGLVVSGEGDLLTHRRALGHAGQVSYTSWRSVHEQHDALGEIVRRHGLVRGAQS